MRRATLVLRHLVEFFLFAFPSSRFSRYLRPSLILSFFLVVTRSLTRSQHCWKIDIFTSFSLLPPFHSLSTRAFGDHCALQRPIIPMQAEFKEVNSGANVFTPFYLNPRRFRMYCQFCIYTPRLPFHPRSTSCRPWINSSLGFAFDRLSSLSLPSPRFLLLFACLSNFITSRFMRDGECQRFLLVP